MAKQVLLPIQVEEVHLLTEALGRETSFRYRTGDTESGDLAIQLQGKLFEVASVMLGEQP